MNAGPDFSDKIGDRLDHPERVPDEFKHLIPDDKARVEWILSHPVSGRVLDVGCSDGAVSRRIGRKWDIAVSAWDITAWNIREPLAPGLESHWDTIFCTEVLEHLFPHESQIALANLWTVLKPGGKLIVTVPNRWPPIELATTRHRWDWPDHRQYFDEGRLMRLMYQFRHTKTCEIVDGIWLGAVCTK